MAVVGKYRLAALDMDGTLLNTAHEISPYTLSVLERAAREGALIALSTGRCLSELRGYLDALPGIAYIIGENGAWVYDATRGATIAQIVIPDDVANAVFDAAEGLYCIPQVFVENQSYMRTTDDAALSACHIADFAGVFREGSLFVDDVRGLCAAHPGKVEKINLYFREASERDLFLKRAEGLSVALSASIGIGCEISPIDANKARGLQTLCDHIGLSVEQVMAVGDGGNDLDIMAAAGLSVAMANAIEPVRALANVLTEDCDHDGAARAIERYLL